MTINEIASLAEVSRSTVSRYLNGGYVSAEKKERIRTVIEETGYTPMKSAQTMRNAKTDAVGVIIPKIDSESISRMVAGISEVLTAAGYGLLLTCTQNREEEELKHLSFLKERHVDGILLLGTVFTPAHLRTLRKLNVPVVILGQHLTGYSCVFSDDRRAAKDLTEHLLHPDACFGYLSAILRDEAVGTMRYRGFLEALEEDRIPFDETRFRECRFSIQSGYEQAKNLLREHPEINTLVCATDGIAAGACMAAREAGLRIPEDLKIAGFGDSTFGHAMNPQLTTVRFYYHDLGREAARLLTELLSGEGVFPTKQIGLNHEVIIRASTGNLPVGEEDEER